VLNADSGGWLSPKAIHKLELREFERDEELEHWGYRSWNTFFKFSRGDVLQSFLEGSDYHHFVSPIEGTITKIVPVPGLLFSDAESGNFDPSGINSVVYDTAVVVSLRRLHPVHRVPAGNGRIDRRRRLLSPRASRSPS
jgi:hypothetical protein